MMEWKGLKSLPLSFRLFISLGLCVAGACYLSLLGSIWTDTEMRMAMIVEGYGTMGTIELVQHSFQYMFWFLCIFGFMGVLFLLTAVSETLKRIYAVLIPVLILSDIGSAWMIRYADYFAWMLGVSGFLLAASFLSVFVLIQYDLWHKG